jgi:hypothetical protein
MSYEGVSVIERVIERRLTQREAARVLGVTSRQVRQRTTVSGWTTINISLQRGQSWRSRTQKPRSRDVSMGRRPAWARTASCWRTASSTRACSLWLRKKARSEWSRAIAKESRANTTAGSLHDPAHTHQNAGAGWACDTLSRF